MRPIDLMLCVNDYKTGQDTGQVDAIHIGNDDNMKLEGLPVECYLTEREKLQIGPVRICFVSYRRWVGNWCWNMARVSVEDAVKVANYLMAHGWDCIEAGTGLFDKWQRGEDLTIDDLRET